MKLDQIHKAVRGIFLSKGENQDIKQLVTDSRNATDPEAALFFAIAGPNHDGHNFVQELASSGFKNFIVEKEISGMPPETNVIQVKSSVAALQSTAALKREEFNKEVVAITGSNGKTIVKEWLAQMLSAHWNVCKSPKSFNSQIGVPLSVWNLNEGHDVGIFEAGISNPEEMEKLENIIQPTQGILTNIGSAHEEYFENIDQKLDEKLILFQHAQTLFYRNDNPLISRAIERLENHPKQLISWGFNATADLSVERVGKGTFQFTYNHKTFQLQFHSENDSYLENMIHCVCFTYFNGWAPGQIQAGIDNLKPIKMRLELKKGINNTYIIDDTYNNDLAGLETALDFLTQQTHFKKKALILSDILQSGAKPSTYKRVAQLLSEKGIDEFYAVGPEISQFKNLFPESSQFFESTEEFLSHSLQHFEKQVILVKGARSFGFERIVKQFMERVHQTVLEINLDAVTHNLNVYRQRLKPSTKLLIMVKALAYGSGGAEIANLLQFHKVDYLGVAYVDEAVQLRKSGIKLPIMVINPSEDDLENLIEFDIEPEIYSFKQFEQFIDFYNKKDKVLKGHFTINTGMNRLGFDPSDLDELIEHIKSSSNLRVQSIYTHLAASDEVEHQVFSLKQLEVFKENAERMEQALGIKTIKHALNSAGIVSFPEYQMDMVRLGIGLYGIEPNGILQKALKPISTLKTVISQIRKVEKGSSIGYGRKGKAEHDMKIATIAIGYADGFSRIFSNGNGQVLINGQLANVIGNVCMDMTMVDITDIDADEGDPAIVFGEKPSISELAQKANTIPYEILTNVSDRVKRVYYTE